jgi:rhodanese-related sulfurtransferase
MEAPRITVNQVKEHMDRGDKVYFVDVRNDEDYGNSDVRLPGALRTSVDDVVNHKDDFPGDALIVTYCT